MCNDNENPLESEFKSRIVREMRDCNAIVLQLAAGRFNTPGTPDTHVTHTYYAGFMEFKRRGGKLRENQAAVIQRINSRKWFSAVVVSDASEHCEHGTIKRGMFTCGTVKYFFDGTGLGLLRELREALKAHASRPDVR